MKALKILVALWLALPAAQASNTAPTRIFTTKLL